MNEVLSYHLRNDLLMHENVREGWQHQMWDRMDFHNHMMGGSSGLSWLLTILFWALVIGGIALLIVLIVRSTERTSSEKRRTPLEILDERYARGEIEEEEYEKRRKKLEN